MFFEKYEEILTPTLVKLSEPVTLQCRIWLLAVTSESLT